MLFQIKAVYGLLQHITLQLMNRILSILLAAIIGAGFSFPATSQKITGADLKNLQQMDDSLGKYGARVLDEPLAFNRLKADSMFTRILVRALRIPYSFYFPFDSMQTAPVVYPDDSSFRLITWHYTLDDLNYHQRGVLQVNTPDGSIKIFPLFDGSDYTDAPEDSIRTPQNWIGAVYYKIIQKSWQDKPVYTLLGYDENNNSTTRKWMEILSFNQKGEPRWGGSFILSGRNGKPKMQRRFLMEYKKQSSAKLNYDPEEDLIIMDHLLSETNQPERKSTLVPGGDYEAFKWVNGSWVNDPKMFTQLLGDGNEPQPATIFDDKGGIDEKMLQQQSEKNMSNKKNATPNQPSPAKKVKTRGN